ncbi:1-(5-phosphoribosyl)-5-[(5-phosphoribosylamino) methylideneamino] imidazole-4-carboxamide isomerase [Bacteroidia bacterium]|nr:1-(5-phosphoribosyl)-5-[(5-phosphoribosylamino) methylideneamino] imidazole-4-carboxamide isomerase [Bacteroidia bacterium]GHT47476.1 1-(5-phosphoribosyl)-5-[(5-phosphoribosylamino) methylideneamino] imidazole-4-carboxamide isomerase [Bacteroidia bacterium]
MIEIIPAIDLINGQCVRLTQGDYRQQTTYGNPLDMALQYQDAGLKRLHLVDLDGAKAAKPVNLAVLESIATKTDLEIQYGGGIKSREALVSVFNAGATRAIAGSIAVAQPELFDDWLDEFTPQRMILGADIRNGFIATHGWLENSEMTIQKIIRQFLPVGLTQVICTDISKDGMLEGPNFALYEELYLQFPTVDITVSGGISSIDDIVKLNEHGMKSVIVGKAIYEGRITLKQISALC